MVTQMVTQMVAQFGKIQQSLLAVQEVPLAQTRRYGMVAGDRLGEADNRLIKVAPLVEKPAPEITPSRMEVARNYLASLKLD